MPETVIASSIKRREFNSLMTNKFIPVDTAIADSGNDLLYPGSPNFTISIHLAWLEGEAQVENSRPSSNFSPEEISKNQSSDQLLVNNDDRVIQAFSRGSSEENEQALLKTPVVIQYEQNVPMIQSSTPENHQASETDSSVSAAMTRKNLLQLGTPPLGTESIVGEAIRIGEGISLGSESSMTDTAPRVSKVSLG